MRILLGLVLLACVAGCLGAPSEDCKDGDCQIKVGGGGQQGTVVNRGGRGGGSRGGGVRGGRGGRSGGGGRSGSSSLSGRTNSFSVQGVLFTIVTLLLIHFMNL